MKNDRTTVFIGLGSNIENPFRQLCNAYNALANIEQSELLGISHIYRSTPVGPQNQPDFLNAVAKLETRLDPHLLLDRLQEIENKQLRVRELHWGPRTIDLDILLFGRRVIRSPRLEVPHPHMVLRPFVVIPLLDLENEIRLPDGRTFDRNNTKLNPGGMVLFMTSEDFRSAAISTCGSGNE